jgi:two-component system phosphate regulon sensor histidine kinase PhoR
MEFRPEVSKIPLLVEEVRDVIRPLAEKGGQQLVLDVVPALTAFLDPARFKQVLYNYLSNAVKFTPAGGIVTVRIQLDGNDCFLLEVEDTGIGIPHDDLPRIFERFYRVDKARSREVGGTGLGLSIVKHIIERANGTVSVESQLGKGSTFTLMLPAA